MSPFDHFVSVRMLPQGLIGRMMCDPGPNPPRDIIDGTDKATGVEVVDV